MTKQTAPAPPARVAGLDGLRAIAVTTVILFHLTPGYLPGGYLGVDVFFVISGFLITALLLRDRERTGRIRLVDFWRRRARRLLPALGALLLACCAAALAVGGNVLIGLSRQVLGAVTFSSNWLSVAAERSYFTEHNPELFRNLWSLAVEEQFYLLWPPAVLLLLVIRSRVARFALVAAVAVGSAVAMGLLYTPGGDPTRVYYGTDTHSFGLALGAVLAIVGRAWPSSARTWPRWTRAALTIAGAAAALGLVATALLLPAEAPLTYRGGLAGVAVLTALAIAGSILPGSLLGRALDVAPLAWVGERSYGLYLWHWPVFVLVVAALPSWPREGPAALALGAAALVVTVVATALSYRFLEQPIRRNGFRASLKTWTTGWGTPARRLAAGTLTVAVVLGLGTASVAAALNDPGKTDAQAIIEAGQASLTPPPPPPPVGPVAGGEETEPAPLPGGDQITAIGDSVMLASARALQEEFPGIRIDAVVSRQLSQAPAIVRALAAKDALRPTLLLGLGTNGPIDRKALEEIRTAAGPDHQIVVVNVQAPRGWTPGVNRTLSIFAQQYRNVELANWHDAIAPYIATLANDQVHPGPTGAGVYARAVRAALQRLAELPPVLTAKEYGLAPHPL
jgi:peptidoglycan/LPS O-acetylase OafA/YrhL